MTAPSSQRQRIVIDAPDGSTILAARHLDATEGPVQIGSTVDTAARSAINRVLDYIAKAHNSPAADSAHRGESTQLPDPESRRRALRLYLEKIREGTVSNSPIPGLCVVCVTRISELEHVDVKERFDSPHGQGWRTVVGAEMHELLRGWAHGEVWADAVRVTHPSLPGGEELLPMLPVVTVGEAGACAEHASCLLPRRETL
jgi:hypothetical protein